MSRIRRIAWAAGIALATGIAAAQPAPGGPGPGARQAEHHGGARWGSEYTPGWALMTPQERDEHRERMRSMKTYDECISYQQQHHELMAARARERGGKPLAPPRHDACSGLKK